MTAPRWICCHLGAREHYAIPRALHGAGRLAALITDAWVQPGRAWSTLVGTAVPRLAERWHPDLAAVEVQDFTTALMAREALWRSQPDGWARSIKRNRWFGARAAAALAGRCDNELPVSVFAHSYSALEIFKVAKARGFATVLGQIDPGPEHFLIAALAAARWPDYGPPPSPPPASYIDAWREECRLADWIVVNSSWSQELLGRAGIPVGKLRVMPLAYTPPQQDPVPPRVYPQRFDAARPLRLLFVGHVSVTKGAPALLEAMSLIGDVPVQLRMVGSIAMRVPPAFVSHHLVQWIGAVSRGDVMQHYRDADVLVFPSLSDGFGMAQVEAQGWRLPIIASRSCGQVVRHGVNGLLLDEVSPRAIAEAVRQLAADPALLQRLSSASQADGSGLSALATALIQLEAA
jgi:glycosyltransferase involved in cell wall biosynthesis